MGAYLDDLRVLEVIEDSVAAKVRGPTWVASIVLSRLGQQVQLSRAWCAPMLAAVGKICFKIKLDLALLNKMQMLNTWRTHTYIYIYDIV